MLQGLRALVVEQEYLIALDIQRILEELGAGEVELFRSVAEAEASWEQISSATLAVVEGHLGAQAVVDFTRRLAEAGVATVVTSADRGLALLFPHAQFVEKPFDSPSVEAALSAALASSS